MENFTLHSPAFGMRIPALKRYAYFALMLTLLLFAGMRSNAQYTPVTVTGFTSDIIANGSTYAGSVSSVNSTGTVAGKDVDNGGYNFLDSTYTGSSVTVTHALSPSGTIYSIATTGLWFQLASSSANNSLQLRNQNDTGALKFVTPSSAATVYVLATSGSGTSTVDMTVVFTDSTSQLFSGQSISDWYNGSTAAIQGIGRVDGSGNFDAGGGTTNPRLYQVPLALSATNYTKPIAYVKFKKTNATGTGYTQLMAITTLAPCAAPTAQPVSLVLTPTTSQISGSFSASTIIPSGYLVVRYLTSAASSRVTPVNGTTYTTTSTNFGTGKVLSAGTSTSFTDVGLSVGVSYTYFVYAYNNTNCGGGPVYDTLSPLTGAQSTLTCVGTLSGVIPVGPTAPASPAGFATLTAAATYINTNGLGGRTTLELQSDYVSTSENFPITFTTNPCISAARPLTIRPSATATGLVITGNNAGPTIDLSGIKNIVIDGRPGGTGTTRQLSIINTNTGGVAIRFTNDASNDKVIYCDLQGQNISNTSSALSGVVYFGTASTILAQGNDNDTLANCNIHATTAGFPAIGICSYGTSSPDSSYNDYGVITNCNIYDVFLAGSASSGVKLDAGNNAWTLSNNSVYQTGTRTYTASATHRGFWITPGTSTTTANGFIITGNYIGGSQPLAGGIADSLTGSSILFYGMDISTGTGGALTQVLSNKITNIYFNTNSTSAGMFEGINVASGNMNIGGANAGNTIGSSTVPGAITVFANSSGGTSYGIRIVGGTTVNVINDTVNNINVTGGTVTTYSSLNAIAASGGTNVVITGNLLANLTTLNSTTTTSTSGLLIGINITAGLASPIITANSIHDLNNYSLYIGTGTSSAVQGILLNSTSITNATVAGNTVYNLNAAGTSVSNTYTPNMWGILVNASTTGVATISNNIVHSFNTPNWAPTGTTGTLFPTIGGIGVNSGAANIYNNMIRLGISGAGTAVTQPIQFIGINKNNAQNNNIWYNSVYIGGTNVAATTIAANTYAFQRLTTGVDSLKNNIFVNVRSNSAATTPKHYALKLNNTTTLLSDNNDYYVNASATGTVLANNNSTDLAALSNIQSTTSLDFASVSVDPLFNNPTGTAATVNLHINAGTTPVAIAAAATPVSLVRTDIDGDTRPGPTGSVNGGTAAPDMGADEFDGVPTITCFPPSGLTVDSLGVAAARLRWTAPAGTAPSGGYQVYYGLSPLAAPTSTTTPSVTVTGTSAIDSLLTASTTYQYYVRSYCGGTSYSAWVGPYTFTTVCGIVNTFPYTESFTTTSLPTCWTNGEGSSGASYHWSPTAADATYGAAGPAAGSYFAYLYVFLASTTYNPYYLNTTNYQLPSVPKRLRYFYYLGNNGYKGTTGVSGSDPYPMTIQVSTDGGTTWSDLYYHSSANSTFATTSATTNWQQNTIDLTPYAGKVIKFRVKSVSNYGSGYCDQGLDEFTIEDIPACGQVVGSSLTATNITTTTAKITWNKLVPVTTYEIYYNTTNVAPTGTTTPTVAGITDTTYALTGLVPSTTYYLWVRSNCGSGNLGTWTNPTLTFNTACGAISAYPYVQSFGSALPNCWAASEATSGASYHWATTGADATYGVSGAAVGSSFAYLRSSWASTTYNPYYLTTYLYTLPSTPKQLTYYYYLGANGYKGTTGATGNDPYPLTIQVSTDTGRTWVDLYYHSSSNSLMAANGNTTNWQINTIYLNAYAGKTVEFRLKSNATGSFNTYADQSIDEFTISDIPSCVQPLTFSASNVTATSAKLTWGKPIALPSSYEVYYTTTNTAPTSTTTPTVTGISDTTTTITGLLSNTTYFAWVRSNCGSSTSVWSQEITFTTPCAAVTALPYVQGFGSSLPSCWSTSSNNASYQWSSSTSDFYGATSAPAGASTTYFETIYGYYPSSYAPYYLTSQAITLPATVQQVTYYSFIGSNGYQGTTGATGTDPYPLILQISTDYGTTWTNLYTHSTSNTTFATSNSATNWQLNTIYLPAYSNKTVIFRFAAYSKAGSTAGNSSISVDEFTVSVAPTCVPPINLVAAPVTTNTATISWTAPTFTTPASYDLYYSTDSTAIPTATTTPNFSGLTTTSKALTGLSSATQYFVWVRSNCGATNGLSAWSATGFNFTTACDVYALPLTQGFNFAFAPDCWSQQFISPSTPAANSLQFLQGGSSNPTTLPYEGAGNVFFNSRSFAASIETRLVSVPFYTVGTASVSTQFYFYNENNTTYSTGAYLAEGVTVQYSLDGTTWTDVQFYPRHDGTLAAGTGQWELKTLTLPAAVANKTFVYFGFKFHSSQGDNMSLDLVKFFNTQVLPVSLISFTGAKQGSSNVLYWTTANEINNKGFEIQRSADGVTFTDLDFVSSKAAGGNSSNSLSYEYTDNSPLTGTNYYRLKQIDNNGNVTYSTVVVLTRTVKNVQIVSIAPNIVTNQTILSLVTGKEGNVSIRIVDAIGRVLSVKTEYLNSGNNSILLNLGYLAAGMYNLQVIDEDTVVSQRFIKK